MVDQETGAARGAICGLLARIFLKEVDADFVASLARPEIADVFEALEPGFRPHLEGAWDESRNDEEAAEYARLFLLPGGVTPFAAGWTDGDEGAVRADLGQRIGAVHALLAVEPADFGYGNVPADHVGMLLALVALAWERDASGGIAERAEALLAPWAPRFARRLQRESESPLYRGAGRLLETLQDAP